MSKTILSTVRGSQNSATTTAGATEYWFLANSTLLSSTTESNRHLTYQEPGTISKLYVRVITNSTSADSTLTVRKNGVDTSLSVSIGAGLTGVFEDSDSVSVSAGDELVYQTISGGTGTFEFSIASVIFDATTNCLTKMAVEGYDLTAASTTHYLGIAGDRSGTTTGEDNTEATIKIAGTAKNGFINVSANGRTTNTTFTLRKNRADTLIVITYGSGETGIKEDISNDISYAVNDELNWEITTGSGVGTLSFQVAAIDFETTTDNGNITANSLGTTANPTIAASTTNYIAIGGANGLDATENNQKQKAREAFTLSNLTVNLNANGVTADSTMTLMKNGVATSIVVTMTASTTGFFSDVTHQETVAADDELDLKLVTGASGTTLRMCNVTIWTTAPAAEAPAFPRAIIIGI